MHHKHKVKAFRWVNGELKIKEWFFDTLAEAMFFGENLQFIHVKVYDPHDQLVQHFQKFSIKEHDCDFDTYA